MKKPRITLALFQYVLKDNRTIFWTVKKNPQQRRLVKGQVDMVKVIKKKLSLPSIILKIFTNRYFVKKKWNIYLTK